MKNDKSILILVRSGPNSLHKAWISDDCIFDIISIPYKETGEKSVKNCISMPVAQGQKWNPLYRYIFDNLDFVSRYEYVWLPDDDLDIHLDNLNSFFSAVLLDRPALAQPALTWDSYFSHILTLAFPGCYARDVEFIEIMAPLFSVEALVSCLWTFNQNVSGWGLEMLWTKIIHSSNFANCSSQILIYDKCTMRHTRPVGGQSRGVVANGFQDPKKEKHDLLDLWGLIPNRRINGFYLKSENIPGLNIDTFIGIDDERYVEIAVSALSKLREVSPKIFDRKLRLKSQGGEMFDASVVRRVLKVLSGRIQLH